MSQVFKDTKDQIFEKIDFLPGSGWCVLSEPVPSGSIHKLRMAAGSSIPPHTHPADEYVLVLSGNLKTGDRICEAGTFLKTPAGTRQGPHEAITDVEILTIRLGPSGTFET